MDMNAGRITPAPGRPGHAHLPGEAGALGIPAQVVVDALDAAATAEEVRDALLSWFADNGVTPTPAPPV